MTMFDVQGVEIAAERDAVLKFVGQPRNLPRWAKAFTAADDRRARLQTPAGAVEIELTTSVNAAAGTVDWRMEFPDRSTSVAQSRVTETTRGTCIYSFVLHAPPVALEQIEGALDAQRATLRSELASLKSILESA